MTPAELAAQVEKIKRLVENGFGDLAYVHTPTMRALIADWEKRGKALEDIASHSFPPFHGEKWINYINEAARDALEGK